MLACVNINFKWGLDGKANVHLKKGNYIYDWTSINQYQYNLIKKS